MDPDNLLGVTTYSEEQMQHQQQAPALEMDVNEHLEGFDMADSDSRPSGNSTLGNGTVDKEMLRKIKRKEKNKQNRRRKKSLMTNLSQVTASNLQESVAALATTIAARSSGIVNDPYGMTSYSDEQSVPAGMTSRAPLDNVNLATGSLISGSARAAAAAAAASTTAAVVAANGVLSHLDKVPSGSALCIMDSTNGNTKLTHSDLAYINECLEKSMFKDLVLISKLKIANTYLSISKRVWVICHSPFTANWVVKKTNEMPAFNGRKYSAVPLKEMDGMTRVSVLVPKECSMVQDYSDLLRILTIQNPGLGNGRAVQELVSVTKRSLSQEAALEGDATSELNRNDPAINGNNLDGTAAKEEISSFGQLPTGNMDDSKHSDAEVSNAEKVTTVSLQPEKPESSQMLKPRSFTFYVDDTWLCELRQLSYQPYLGMRRLLFVVQERVLNNVQELSNRKKRRGGNAAKKARWALKLDSSSVATAADTGAVQEQDRFTENKDDFQ